MKRSEYLGRCQRWAVSKDESCLVEHKGLVFSPYAYILSFDSNGKPEHTAMMKDLHSNTDYFGILSRVKEAKDGSL